MLKTCLIIFSPSMALTNTVYSPACLGSVIGTSNMRVVPAKTGVVGKVAAWSTLSGKELVLLLKSNTGVAFVGKSAAPAADGIPYEKENKH